MNNHIICILHLSIIEISTVAFTLMTIYYSVFEFLQESHLLLVLPPEHV